MDLVCARRGPLRRFQNPHRQDCLCYSNLPFLIDSTRLSLFAPQSLGLGALALAFWRADFVGGGVAGFFEVEPLVPRGDRSGGATDFPLRQEPRCPALLLLA